ncbi:MAG: heme ABC exporter ATP-binding protein CcmA [Gemmatimonadales bacterium]|nr:heme ABC exporter ATP-binding protein CcmA [Gemmatimonadales bacterium]MDZ4391276.1 heme ABC exporter ATP-binding protein CcmA [Gemmatimonadales bacterium]
MPPLLQATSLVRRFGSVTALAGVSLTVDAGEVVLLLGPNGAGKTTLLRCLSGLARPLRGTVQLGGADVHADPSARAGFGFLSHNALVYEDLTPRENLRFAAALQGLHDAEVRISEALERANLTDRADTLVRGFSRGMLQRLALARATLHQPALLLLDEPFTGLDVTAATVLRERLMAEREAGTAIVCVTHDPAELWEAATRVVILVGGRVVGAIPRPAALEGFRDIYAAALAA